MENTNAPIYRGIRPSIVSGLKTLDSWVSGTEDYLRRNARAIGRVALIAVGSAGAFYGGGTAMDHSRLRETFETEERYGVCDFTCQSTRSGALNNEQGKMGALGGLILGLAFGGAMYKGGRREETMQLDLFE
ncbi:MAG: hypothetical protein JSV63_00835 [Candidatus Aenigmatarchaeota archaeon]|nr:MAG: hypothetical protein JSV63_00835 [Candidatus Aenigmarchaeota archaeon]